LLLSRVLTRQTFFRVKGISNIKLQRSLKCIFCAYYMCLTVFDMLKRKRANELQLPRYAYISFCLENEWGEIIIFCVLGPVCFVLKVATHACSLLSPLSQYDIIRLPYRRDQIVSRGLNCWSWKYGELS
jgi:hypothetical protein